MVDEAKINPNLNTLYDHFSRALDKYFDDGRPIPDFFEETACYCCGSKKIESEFMANRFRHVRCAECQLVYVTPRLKEKITHDLYNEGPYTEFYKIKLIPSLEYRREVLAREKFRQITEKIKGPGRVLDIGSGVGEVLSVFKENGWDCTGIEFNEFAAGFAREQFGLNIINKSIYDFDGSDKYDLIMLWGVLEHFYDPNKVLAKLPDLLNDDGLLLLEVPAGDSMLVRFYERTEEKKVDRIIEGDRHLMLFSCKAFQEMVTRAGFAVEEICANGLDISTLNRLELKGKLSLENVNALQDLLDRSLQADLLRGFFKKA